MGDFERRTEQARADLAAAQRADLSYRHHLNPDPASLLLIANAPSRRLWERHPGDNDFLALRIEQLHLRTNALRRLRTATLHVDHDER